MIVVTRWGDAGDWLPESFTRAVKDGRGFRTVCADAELGMSRSLQCGLRAAEAGGRPDAVMVLLGDQPFVGKELISRLVHAFRTAEDGCDYCAALHRAVPRPPVLLARTMFDAVKGLDGDEGARSLLRLKEYRGMLLEDTAPERFWDADTPENAEEIRVFFQKYM